jgi:hypothetical protein
MALIFFDSYHMRKGRKRDEAAKAVFRICNILIYSRRVMFNHRVIMYSIETKATSRLPYFGHPPFNTYLSVVCLAAVATELGGIKILYIHLGRFVSCKKCKLCIILGLLKVVLAINITLTTAR